MPNSFAFTLIWRRSRARMVLSAMGISYCLPVRLSVMVSVSRGTAAASWLAVSGDGFTGFMAAAPWSEQQPAITVHQLRRLREWYPSSGAGGGPRAVSCIEWRLPCGLREARDCFRMPRRDSRGRRGRGPAPSQGVICLLTNIVITSILRASKLPLGGHYGHHPQSRQPRPLRSRLAQYLSLVFFRRLL